MTKSTLLGTLAVVVFVGSIALTVALRVNEIPIRSCPRTQAPCDPVDEASLSYLWVIGLGVVIATGLGILAARAREPRRTKRQIS
jgi:hypothetical protein